MQIMTVVGARPNFMKAAPIIAAIGAHNDRLSRDRDNADWPSANSAIRHVLVHTGQHYDQLMSDSFFADLNLPKPDFDLGVGSWSHAMQTAEIMRKFESVLLQEKPDVLLVVGDVNSTLACALVAAKISFGSTENRPLIAHVEAGLRSLDRTMPEEINRVLTDQLSDLLFVSEESGLRNLALEGVPVEKVHFVGNTMIDSLLTCTEKANRSAILDALGLQGGVVNDGTAHTIVPYALLTLHRPANVDCAASFLNILDGLEEVAEEWPVIFPAHPRTRNRIKEFHLENLFESDTHFDLFSGSAAPLPPSGIRLIEPLGYLDFLCLMKNASLVVTDSGGIQEETTCLGIPCVTVRGSTERPVTIESGTNVLAGTTKERIKSAIRRQRERKNGTGMPPKWDGQAAVRIVDILTSVAGERTASRQSAVSQPGV